MAGLDFDGDYGRQYVATIRQAMLGYDTMLQLGSCALAATCPQAATALVVGPGPGEELEGLLQALPADRVALILASRNSQVFSLDAGRLAAGLAPSLQLFQALFSRLRISRRPA